MEKFQLEVSSFEISHCVVSSYDLRRQRLYKRLLSLLDLILESLNFLQSVLEIVLDLIILSTIAWVFLP